MDEDTLLRSEMELAQGPHVTKCRVRTQAPKCCFQHYTLYALHWGVNHMLSRDTSCASLLLPVQSPPQTHCLQSHPPNCSGQGVVLVSACGLTSPGETKGPYDSY